MRLVLDTNCVVSAFLWGGTPRQVIDAAVEDQCRLFTSGALLAETTDPDDDQVLACAVAAHTDLIVSGDSDLLGLKTYQGIPIATAAEALRRIAATD
jgi:predicted nucleic acid-binding protein